MSTKFKVTREKNDLELKYTLLGPVDGFKLDIVRSFRWVFLFFSKSLSQRTRRRRQLNFGEQAKEPERESGSDVVYRGHTIY